MTTLNDARHGATTPAILSFCLSHFPFLRCAHGRHSRQIENKGATRRKTHETQHLGRYKRCCLHHYPSERYPRRGTFEIFFSPPKTPSDIGRWWLFVNAFLSPKDPVGRLPMWKNNPRLNEPDPGLARHQTRFFTICDIVLFLEVGFLNAFTSFAFLCHSLHLFITEPVFMSAASAVIRFAIISIA
jgi:hypothetical protein